MKKKMYYLHKKILCYLHKKKQRYDVYASEKLSTLFWQSVSCSQRPNLNSAIALLGTQTDSNIVPLKRPSLSPPVLEIGTIPTLRYPHSTLFPLCAIPTLRYPHSALSPLYFWPRETWHMHHTKQAMYDISGTLWLFRTHIDQSLANFILNKKYISNLYVLIPL